MKQLLDGYIDLILQTVSHCKVGGREERRGEGGGGEGSGGVERGVDGGEGREWGERGGLRSKWEVILLSINSQ